MPRRTNSFQRLIARVEGSLNHGDGRVSESLELRDKITGQLREVDVVVQLTRGSHPVVIAIECRSGSDRARPVSVEWVEQMWGKHVSLPTDKLVLVAKAGFSKAAKAKATWLNVECFSLAEAETLDWKPKLAGLIDVEVEHFLLPQVTKAALIFAEPRAVEAASGDLDLANPQLHTPDGLTQSASDFVKRWVEDPAVVAHLQKVAFADGVTEFKFRRLLPSGTVVVGRSGARFAVVAIDVTGSCRKVREKVRLTHNAYGQSAVAHGKSAFMANNVSMVFTERQGTEPIVGVSVERRTKA